jgi:predicted esterase
MPVPTATAGLSPLEGEWLEALDDVGYVALPTGATEVRPVVVAVHGAGDRPDWACSEWRAIFGPKPFIVCPRGTPMAGGFVWSSADALKVAIGRAVDGTRVRHGAHLDEGPRVYAGFSQGAILGASIVEGAPDVYPYAIFHEGLGDVGGRRFTRAFAEHAGKRIILACSQAGCDRIRRAPLAALVQAHIDAKLVYAGNIGHTINGAVIEAIKQELAWLVAGDERWKIVLP